MLRQLIYKNPKPRRIGVLLLYAHLRNLNYHPVIYIFTLGAIARHNSSGSTAAVLK